MSAYPASAHNADQHAALLGHTIDKSRLQFVSVLGLGAYGVVYLARDVSAEIGLSSATDPNSPYDGKGYYAVKCLNKIGLDSRQRSFQRREIALHTLASSHPNVVSLHRVVETSSVIYVILAYCPDGDLFSMITDNSRYLGRDELIRSVFLQIIDAVEHCHRLGIYHRDLKPENILCCDGGRRVMLADFGLATAEKTSWDFGCGSTFYMSPECQGGIFQRLGSYSTLHNDIWSLGVILVNLTCGRNPWKQACPSDETFRAYLDNPNFMQCILPISDDCNDLLKRIFSLNPMARISMAELKLAVRNMPRWTMTEGELQRATKATKEAARAFISTDAAGAHPATAAHGIESDPSMTPSERLFEDYPESLTASDDSSTVFSFGSSIDFSAKHAPPSKPLPPLPSLPQSEHADMDLDAKPSTPRFMPRSPLVGFSTPRPKAKTQFPASRRDSSSSDDVPSSASSGSSSGDSWSDQPPTPDTPTFPSVRSLHGGSLQPDLHDAVQKMENLVSAASSKASFASYYGEYDAWASAAADDSSLEDAIRIRNSPPQKDTSRLSGISNRILGSPIRPRTAGARPRTADSKVVPILEA